MFKILDLSMNYVQLSMIRRYFYMPEDNIEGENPTKANHFYRPEDRETWGRRTLLTQTSKKI